MGVPFGDLYRAGHERVVALARTLSDDDLARAVPACPEWTVRDVVVHLTALAAESTSGRMEPGPGGVPDDTVTARQVAERADTDLEAVLAEWTGVVDAVVTALDTRQAPPNIALDVLTHEADVAEALGRPAPPAEAWGLAAQWMARGMVGQMAGPGTLVVRTGDAELRGGSGAEPTSTVAVEPYELWRGLFSRRSRAQIAAWDWSGDPTRWIDRFGVFGPRDDDQPRPA